MEIVFLSVIFVVLYVYIAFAVSTISVVRFLSFKEG